MAKLRMYGQINSGKLQPSNSTGNLIEVMACEGGCISGPAVITNPKIANVLLDKYVQEGSELPENK